MDKVILLESIDEAKEIIGKKGKGFLCAKDTRVIALHPKTRIFLKEAGIESKDTIDYFNNDAQHRVILKTERIAVELLRNIHLSDDLGMKEGYAETCLYHIRFYLNHFLWILEILKGIKDKHTISEIHCCLPETPAKMYSRKAFIQDEERFLGLLSGDFCKANNIKFCGYYLKKQRLSFLSFLSVKVVRKIGEIIAFLDYLFLVFQKPNDKKTVVVPALSYRMGNLLSEIKKKNSGVRFIMIWEGKSTFKQEVFKIYLSLVNTLKKLRRKNIVEAVISLDLIKNRFKKDTCRQDKIKDEFNKLAGEVNSRFKNSLVHQGISFREYFAQKLDKSLKYEILSLQHTTKVLSGALKRLKPKLVMSMYSAGSYFMMGELGRTLGFKSLSISHGTHVPPNNEFEEIENYRLAKSVILNAYEYVAVQTPWAYKFLDYYKDSRPRLVCGPLLYSKKNAETGKKVKAALFGLKNNEKIIVHASTQKTRYGMRFHIDETLDEYISSLVDLVSAVSKLEDTFLVIRPHPICNISDEGFLKILPSSGNFKIMSKGPFQSVLSAADLLVSYSSTCIEEAIQSGVPVILFDKWKRYNHFNIKEIRPLADVEKRPAYYVTEPRVLKECIPKIFDVTGKQPLVNADLEGYKYPKEFRANFDDFVKKALTEEIVN